MRIDAHHHLWKYSREQYPWMLEGMDKLRRDFLIDDVVSVMREGAIDGLVTVQARQTVVETDWLLQLASAHTFMRGVVGWVPLTDVGVEAILEKFCRSPKFKAVRHVLHDEADDQYILRDDFNRGVGKLKDFELRYDILIFERHLPQTIQFVDRHPNQVFIVDHIAKPKIKDHTLSRWREYIRDLARRQNVYCKLSGMVTEADWGHWGTKDLNPFIDTVLECFGADRLMFGSDWPVLLVASTYTRWIETVEQTTSSLSRDEQAQLFGETAIRAYGL